MTRIENNVQYHARLRSRDATILTWVYGLIALLVLLGWLHTLLVTVPAVQDMRYRFDAMDGELDAIDDRLAELREAIR